MAQLYNYKTKKVEEVPDEIATQAIGSKTHSPLKGTNVNMISPTGDVGEIPAELALQYVNEGARVESTLETRERLSGIAYGDSEVQAFGEGALRGLTFGLSDRALIATGLTTQQGMRERKRLNPFSSTAGEVTSIALSTILTGGTTGAAAAATGTVGRIAQLGKVGAAISKAGRVAGTVPRSIAQMGQSAEKMVKGTRALQSIAGKGLAGKAASKGVQLGLGSAVEGAFYGASKLISEDALGEADFNAERLVSYMGLGALMGGVSGAAIGGASQIAKGMIDPAKSIIKDKVKLPSNIKGWLDDTANEKALDAALGVDKATRIKLAKFKQLDRARKYSRGKIREQGAMTTEDFAPVIAKDFEDAGNAVGDYVTSIDKLAPDIGVDEFVKPSKIASRIEKDILSKMDPEKPATLAAYRRAKADFDYYSTRKNDFLTFSFMRESRAEIDRNSGNATENSVKDILGKLGKILNEESESSADAIVAKYPSKLGKDAVESYKELKTDWAMKKTLNEAVQKRVLGNQSNRSIAITDYGAAGIGSVIGKDTITGGLGFGAALGAFNKYIIRERGDAIASMVADKAHRLAAVEIAANSVSRAIDTGVNTALKSMVIPRKLAPTSILLTRPDNASPIGSIGRVSYSAEAKRKKKDRSEHFKDRVEELSSIVTGMTASGLDGIQGPLGGVASRMSDIAPNTSGNMTVVSRKAVEYLLDKAPKSNAMPSAFPGLRREWQPTDEQITKWEKIVHAIERPISILESLEDGTLTKESVDAVRSVYPKMYENMIEGITEKLSEMKEQIPFQSIISLSLLFSQPFDPSLTPSAIALNQQLVNTGQELESGKQRVSRRKTAKSRDLRDYPERTMTETQRITSGR